MFSTFGIQTQRYWLISLLSIIRFRTSFVYGRCIGMDGSEAFFEINYYYFWILCCKQFIVIQINRNNQFSGWPMQYFGKNGNTDGRQAQAGIGLNFDYSQVEQDGTVPTQATWCYALYTQDLQRRHSPDYVGSSSWTYNLAIHAHNAFKSVQQHTHAHHNNMRSISDTIQTMLQCYIMESRDKIVSSYSCAADIQSQGNTSGFVFRKGRHQCFCYHK